MKKTKTIVSILLAATLIFTAVAHIPASAESGAAKITVNAKDGSTKISDNMFGIFFEDINFSADGGLSSNLIRNNSFEQRLAWAPDYDCRMTGWEVTEGEAWPYRDAPMNENNPTYLHATRASTVLNHGYPDGESQFGILLKKGETYDFSFYARGNQGDLIAWSFINENGKSVANGDFTIGSDFSKLSAEVKPSARAYTVLKLTIPEGDEVDFFELVSQSSFGYGDSMWQYSTLRADLVKALKDLNPAFMRFPGGCVAEGAYDWEYAYNWKYTIGPLEQRHQIPNLWGYNQSMAVGFYEYFCLCDYLECEPLPVVHAGLMCQGRGDWKYELGSEEMNNHIQDILDLIEYANGSTDTEWGAVRAQNGHPEPFNMKYLAVGNENWMEDYWERFDVIYNAVKEAYPDITIISSAGAWADGKEHEYAWEIINEKYTDTIVDEHYYVPTWWVFANAEKYDSYPRDGAKVFVGEYAVHREGGEQITKNNLQVAVHEGVHMTNLVRNGDIVEMACYAPLFAREGYTQWAPNLIWFTSDQVVRTPSYYVQQLFMNNTGTAVLKSELTGNSENIYQAVSVDEENKQIYVAVVNISDESRKLEVDFDGTYKLDASVEQRYVGSGLFNLSNRTGTLSNLVTPRYQKLLVTGNKLTQTLSPWSVNVFCLSYDGANTYRGLTSDTGYTMGSQIEVYFLEILANFIVWFTKTDVWHFIEGLIKGQG